MAENAHGMKRDGSTDRFGVVLVLLCAACLAVLSGCSVRTAPYPPPREPSPTVIERVPPLGFTIQAGAFSRVDNASRFADHLNDHGLDAYHYLSEQGFYRVRFGNFRTREEALRTARELVSRQVIEEYYIVRPDQYALSLRAERGDNYVRGMLVDTARSFLGIPYRWGGASEEEGFDCSGLAMSVYRLNGFNLPRTSREQFRSGAPVDRRSLSEGDLVFFDTRGRGTVSHVGIYAGGGRFIHAPRSGRSVSFDSLDNAYYRSRFLGARTYL